MTGEINGTEKDGKNVEAGRVEQEQKGKGKSMSHMQYMINHLVIRPKILKNKF